MRRRARNMRGELEVRSGPEVGTEVELRVSL
jgi:signal transduction histidine kinase